MRVADRLRYEVFKNNLGSIKTKVDTNQIMIASGRRILKPSDDPVATGTNMEMQAARNMGVQYKRNLERLKMTGSFYETSINTISDLLTRVKELAISMASDNVDAEARRAAAEEVDGIIEQLVTVGNTKVAGTYIFGGKKGTLPPFDAAGNFTGTDDVTHVAVDAKSTMDSGISGKTVFDGSDVSIFTALTDFKEHLLDNNVDGIRSDLDEIDKAVTLTANNLSFVGSYTKNIDMMIETNGTKDLTISETQSQLVDADMVQLIADFNILSTAYQSVLYSMSKLQELSVLNYLG